MKLSILLVTTFTVTYLHAADATVTAANGSTTPGDRATPKLLTEVVRIESRAQADLSIADNAQNMIHEGRQTFRFDTFGDEDFWGNTLKLHEAIAGAANGGVGPGLSPKMALALGLKVDAEAVPANVVAALQAGQVNLDEPTNTLALLQLNAVVGITGFFTNGALKSVGIQCALCHSTVDDSPGIGQRLDGWPNRDLNVGSDCRAGSGFIRTDKCSTGEVGVDDFQSNRSPDKRYRTSPLKGLFAHQKGGFFHDGRLATLRDVVDHYNQFFGSNLTDPEKNDLVEYLKSL